MFVLVRIYLEPSGTEGKMAGSEGRNQTACQNTANIKVGVKKRPFLIRAALGFGLGVPQRE